MWGKSLPKMLKSDNFFSKELWAVEWALFSWQGVLWRGGGSCRLFVSDPHRTWCGMVRVLRKRMFVQAGGGLCTALECCQPRICRAATARGTNILPFVLLLCCCAAPMSPGAVSSPAALPTEPELRGPRWDRPLCLGQWQSSCCWFSSQSLQKKGPSSIWRGFSHMFCCLCSTATS